MPANTSMPTALPSEARTWTGSGWRAVEAQHRNATLGLVHGHLGNQALLEDIIEEIKPVLPAEAEGLPVEHAVPLPGPATVRIALPWPTRSRRILWRRRRQDSLHRTGLLALEVLDGQRRTVGQDDDNIDNAL